MIALVSLNMFFIALGFVLPLKTRIFNFFIFILVIMNLFHIFVYCWSFENLNVIQYDLNLKDLISSVNITKQSSKCEIGQSIYNAFDCCVFDLENLTRLCCIDSGGEKIKIDGNRCNDVLSDKASQLREKLKYDFIFTNVYSSSINILIVIIIIIFYIFLYKFSEKTPSKPEDDVIGLNYPVSIEIVCSNNGNNLEQSKKYQLLFIILIP